MFKTLRIAAASILVLGAGVAFAGGPIYPAETAGSEYAAQARSHVSPAWKDPSVLYGSPANPERVQRVIALSPGIKYVNVKSGEVVAFRAGNKQIAWAFSERLYGGIVDLGLLLKDMPEASGVRVYIERSELYKG